MHCEQRSPPPTPPTYLIQRKRRVPRHSKVSIEREVRHILGRLAHIATRADLAQRLADEQDAVDKQAVGGALDLEVAEEGVCAEEG